MANDKPTMTRTDRNLWNSIVAEAMANLKYNAFAHRALEEGHPEIAQVFQEVAGAEVIHGINHLRVAGDILSTKENLQNVITGEAKEASTLYPRMIKEALDDGHLEAAETLTLAMDREKHHILMFTQAQETLQVKESRRKPVTIEDYNASSASPHGTDQTPAQPSISTAYSAASRELEGERWRVAAFGRIREVVFGAQDGLLSTVALVTSVAVAGIGTDNTLILVAGLAAALSGMVSMSVGAFLSSRSEQEVQRAEIAKEAEELDAHPAEELAELVVLYQREGLRFNQAREMAEHIASDKDLWLRTLVEKELGLSPDIISNPIKDAMAMGAAFIVAALVPIFPYFFIDDGPAIGTSIGAALAGLFVLGMGKGYIVHKSPIVQGMEMLIIGAVAAGIGYGLGIAVPAIINA
jgi:VIT1/CCC1 family predicted Fe2+/Mn2+ transporter/rubrerythrin